jgi:hypothetical protein
MSRLVKGILIAVVAFVVLMGIVIGVVVGVGMYGSKEMKRAANERAAAHNLGLISLGEIRYYTEHGEYAMFDELVKARFLDGKFAGTSPVVDGYVFILQVTPAVGGQRPSFTASAHPADSQAGTRHFFLDHTSSTIYVNPNQPASANDPAFVR